MECTVLTALVLTVLLLMPVPVTASEHVECCTQAGGQVVDEARVSAAPASAPTQEDNLVADMLLPRKKRKLYASAVKAQAAKRSRAETLKARAAAAKTMQ